MSVSYRIDPSEGIIYEVYKGVITPQELIELIKGEHKDPLYKYGMPTIVDLTGISADWDYLEINQFRNFVSSIYSNYNERVKWALIAPPASERHLIKILDVMNEVAGNHVEMRIFEEEKEAFKWIKAR